MSAKQEFYHLMLIETTEQITCLAELAVEIWTEHYNGIIGAEQTSYMLSRFQSADAIAKDIREKGYRYTVVEAAGRWLGYSATVIQNNKVLFLSKLYVHKESRGLGIGGALFNDAVAQARNAGCESIQLTVNRNNSDSIAVYKHLGCKVIREQRADIGNGYYMDDYVFSCPVNQFSE